MSDDPIEVVLVGTQGPQGPAGPAGADGTDYEPDADLDGTGATDVAADLYAEILANIDPETGASVVRLGVGKFLCNLNLDTTKVNALITAGCRHIRLVGKGKRATQLLHDNDHSAIIFDMTGRASSPVSIAAAPTLQVLDSYNYLHRIVLADVAATGWTRNDRINIQSQDRPEYDSTGRWVGETFRIKSVDTANNYVWVDGQLEYIGSYATSIVGRKLSDELSLAIEDMSILPTRDSSLKQATISAITKAANAQVTTSAAHGFVVGDVVVFSSGVGGMTQIRNEVGTVQTVPSSTTFTVNIDSTGFGTYTSAGTVSLDREPSIILRGATDCFIRDCHFAEPWYVSVRMETCADCFVEDCEFRDGLNQPSANQLTYGLQAYAACFNCWLHRCTFTGYRHAFTTDGASGKTTYDSNSWAIYGQPVYCGAKDCEATESKGAPYDTHEEGANIQFINCVSGNAHSADEANAFIGAAFQIRCRRAIIKDCLTRNANWGISWKPYEHGTDNRLVVQNFSASYLDYASDQSRGIYVSSGGTLTNRPTLELENCSFDTCGISVESDVALNINAHNVKSARPHRGHIDLANGARLYAANMVWDSRSSSLPYAAGSNRTLFGILMAGTSEAHVAGLSHILGADPGLSTSRNITAATQANPCVITTSASHGFTTGAYVEIASVGGMTQLNGNRYEIRVLTTTTFELVGVDATAFGAYTSGGTATLVTQTQPACVFENGDNTSGKTVALSGYREIRPTSVRERPILEVGQETNFTVVSAEPLGRSVVLTAAGNYTVLPFDDVVIVNKNSGAATTITLPANPPKNKRLTIKDGKGDAVTNAITVSATGSGAGTIDGQSSLLLINPYEAVDLLFNGKEWNIV